MTVILPPYASCQIILQHCRHEDYEFVAFANATLIKKALQANVYE
mgnify:CR=1